MVINCATLASLNRPIPRVALLVAQIPCLRRRGRWIEGIIAAVIDKRRILTVIHQ
jgi:hypothetical protein